MLPGKIRSNVYCNILRDNCESNIRTRCIVDGPLDAAVVEPSNKRINISRLGAASIRTPVETVVFLCIQAQRDRILDVGGTEHLSKSVHLRLKTITKFHHSQ